MLTRFARIYCVKYNLYCYIYAISRRA